MKKIRIFQKFNNGCYIPIDFDTYSNPYCPTNISGNVIHLYNLFQLVDSISLVSDYFMPTSYSFSRTYRNIIRNAVTKNNHTEDLFIEARDNLDSPRYKFSSIVFGTNDFWLIETSPTNFWDYKGQRIEFKIGGSNAEFISVNNEEYSVMYEDACMVTLKRPWFISEIFTLKDWSIDLAIKGDISSGEIVNNGLLPMVITQLVLSRKINGEITDCPYLVAVISDIIPFSPSLDSQSNELQISAGWAVKKKISKPSINSNNNNLNKIQNDNLNKMRMERLRELLLSE